MAPNEHRPDSSTQAGVAPADPRKTSGSYRIDLSSVPPDESSAKDPWAKLTQCPEGQAELSLPDCRPLRRPLPLVDLDILILESLREWLGDDAVRHWVALRQLKAAGGRAQWKLDAHMDAIGDRRDDAEARLRAAREVERLTGLQMTVFTAKGDLRLRAPLLVPVATTERKRGGYWLVDDMLLRIHPMLSDPLDPRTARDTARPPGQLDAAAGGGFPPNEPTTARITRPPPTEPVPRPVSAPLPSMFLPDDDPTLAERDPTP